MRAMWSGAVSFGLVSVPIKLYSATTNHDIRFHQVHAADGGRIKYKRTCSLDGEEVEYADIVKGYETDEGELITLTEEDLDSLPTATGHEIDVIEFVPADQIDPLLFDKSYYLEPEPKAAKPYALLREALVQTERMAVVKVALRQRESIALLRVRDKAIVLQTMLWPDEVREPDFDILDAEVELRPQELQMAASLIESLGADFDPTEFQDEYRDAVVEMIERKKTTGDSRPAPVADTRPDDGGDSMTDLLTALQRSVEAAKGAAGGSGSGSPARRRAAPATEADATSAGSARRRAAPATPAAEDAAPTTGRSTGTRSTSRTATSRSTTAAPKKKAPTRKPAAKKPADAEAEASPAPRKRARKPA
jgi:DNA end-binding protein Ku